MPNKSIPQSNLPIINRRKPYIRTETNQSYQSISQEGKDHEQKAGTADSKCVGVERLCEGANIQIPFNDDEINLIYQFGERSKAETCASLSAILPQIKDSDTKQIVSDTLKKLNALSEKTCAELTEHDHCIKTRLAKAKEQAKQPTVAEGKKHRTHSKGKGDMEL